MLTRYLWDYATNTCLAEVNEQGETTVNYTVDPQTGELISENHGGQEVYHRYDGDGNTRQTADSAGNVLGEATYDAFGETVAESGDMKTTYRFQGQRGFSTDALTGDVSRTHQNYSPSLGRQLSLVSSGRAFDSLDGSDRRSYSFSATFRRSQPVPAADVVTIAVNTVGKRPLNSGCGGHSVTFRFSIVSESDIPSGYVVQILEYHWSHSCPVDKSFNLIPYCCLNSWKKSPFSPARTTKPTEHFWEAFPISKEKPFAIDLSQRPGSDGTYGVTITVGLLRFYPAQITGNLEEKWKDSKHPHSRTAPSTTQKPGFWRDRALATEGRSVFQSWCCCESQDYDLHSFPDV